MKQYMLLYTDINKGNKTISFDPYIKQLGIQTSRAGYRFKIYLNDNSTAADPIIIGNTKIYELDLFDTNLHIEQIEFVGGKIFNENDFVIIDTNGEEVA